MRLFGLNLGESTDPKISAARDALAVAEFEPLAMPLFDSLYNFAHWLTRNREDAEDLVQETYLKALRGFASFQPGTNFRAWIFKILRNTCYTAAGKQRGRTTVAIESEEDIPGPLLDFINPESLLITAGEIEELQQAIDQLPPSFREVLLLRETENASYQEISAILSIPMGTVMSRLQRARAMIRNSLLKPGGKSPIQAAEESKECSAANSG